ncbi:MAG: FecR family protein [Spirosomataceae bacterium]
MKQPPISRAVLINYLEGKASAFQKQAIDEWIKNPQNSDYFYQVLEEWELQNLRYVASHEEGFQKHLARLNAQESIAVPLHFSRKKYWAMAASIAFVLCLGAGYFFKDWIQYKNIQTAYGETKEITLEDGSVVYLNANSSLKVPRFGFGSSTRTVELSGEAIFSIKHTPTDQKFIVHTQNKFDVVVLGTEFTVFSRARGSKVVLKKGKVNLQYHTKVGIKQLIMAPGDLVSLSKVDQTIIKKKVAPEDFAAWKDHEFVFNQITMNELSTIFYENFGLTIQIQDKTIQEMTLSGSFKANNAQELLEVLTRTAGLNYQQEGNVIIISETK